MIVRAANQTRVPQSRRYGCFPWVMPQPVRTTAAISAATAASSYVLFDTRTQYRIHGANPTNIAIDRPLLR